MMARFVEMGWAAWATLMVGFVSAGCSGGEGYVFADDRAVYRQFDGELAYAHVEKLVGFGPRPSGSPALEESRQYLESVLDSVGWDVKRQAFESATPMGKVKFANLRARIRKGEQKADWDVGVSTVIGSHYDTKFFKRIEFVGANDGGSSTGLLLELARVVAARQELAEEMELVFFDGEEAFIAFTETDGLYGSREYGKMIRTFPEEIRPKFGIVFDMVGDTSLKLTLPTNSSRRIIGHLYSAADELGSRSSFGSQGGPILDDHVPLENAGLEVIDIIDMDYSTWHTSGDTLEYVAPESLEIVGQAGLLMIEKYLLGSAD